MGRNADTVRAVYDGAMRGDMSVLIAAMDTAIQWREPASLPFGDHVGPDAVIANVFMKVAELVDSMTLTADEMIDGGDAVVTLGRYAGTGKATGQTFVAPFVHVWRFGPSGSIVECQVHTDTYAWCRALDHHPHDAQA